MTADAPKWIQEVSRLIERIRIGAKRPTIDYVLIVAVNVFIFRNFFIQPGLLVQGVDVLLWIANAKYYENFRWLHIWYTRSSLGFVRQPTLLEDLLGTASAVVGDPFWVYRLLMPFIGILSSATMYVYIFSRIRDRSSALVGALFYILNPWFLLEAQNSHPDLLLPLALLPLILYTFDLGQVLSTSIFVSLFVSSAHPQAIYLFGFFLIGYFILTPLTKKRAAQFFKISLISTGLSAFYLIPFLFATRSFGYGGLVGDWVIEDISYFILEPIHALLILVTSISLWLSAWHFRKAYSRVRFFIISSLLLTTLAVSPSFALSRGVYYWIFQNVPLFNIFRVPSRLLMVTVLCDSYLLAVVFSGAKQLKKKIAFRLKRPIYLSASRFSSSLTVALLVVIIALGWLQLSFNPGNYSPPEEWLDPYYWLRQKEGNWRLHAVGGEYWIPTPWGMTQEYGIASTIFSDKPVIGVPSKAASSYFFLKYLEHLSANNETDQWLKIVGALNAKYVTLASYASLSQRYFLLNQEGIRNSLGPVIDFGDAAVYENPYWMPLIYVVPKTAYVASGFSSVTNMLHWPGFEFNRTSYRLLKSGASLPLNESSMLIYEDQEFMDFLMITYNDGVTIPAYQYGSTNSRDPTKFWIRDDTQVIEGKTVFNDFTLTTVGNRSIDIPFFVNSSGFYEIWVRMLAGLPNQGSLTIEGFTVNPNWTYPTFKWFKLGRIYLSKGERKIHLRNSLGKNDIDMIVLARPADFERHVNEVANNFQNYAGKIVFLANAHDMFFQSSNSTWKLLEAPLISSDGYALHSEVGGELKASLYIPRSSEYSFALRVKTNGTITLQIGGNALQLNPENSTELKEYFFNPVLLDRNNYTINLRFDEETTLDQFMFQTVDGEDFTNGALASVRQLSFAEVSPTEYYVYYNNSSPSYMIFSSSYNPSWRLFLNETEVEPIMMYGGVSGFYINQKTPVALKLVFTEQKYVYLGIGISSFTWLTVGVLVGAQKIRQQRNKRRTRYTASTNNAQNSKKEKRAQTTAFDVHFSGRRESEE